MPKLLIVESPAKAGTIKKYLGKDYDIVASMGHVRDLPKSSLGVDTEKNFEPKYIPIKGKQPLIKELKTNSKKYEAVYLATDPDREGEAISWHLAALLGLDVNEKNRVTFNEISKKAVLSGIENARCIDMNLVDAQQARRVLDRLVGYKISPFLWKKVKKGLSAGRVQSVVLRLLCDRENEIDKFVPEEYWNLSAFFKGTGSSEFSANFFGTDKGKTELRCEADVNKVLEGLRDARYIVNSVTKKKKSVKAAPPYITSTLQREASRRLGFKPEVTMRIAQQLYEGVELKGLGSTGLITYMRTDSLRISEEALSLAREFIAAEYGSEYCPSKPNYFNKSKSSQDAHEAIRPTDVALTPDSVKASLSAQQYKLYKLIWSRFIASQMVPAVYDVTAIEIGANEYIFKLQYQKISFKGYTALYSEDKDEDETISTGRKIPALKEGTELEFLRLEPEQKFTLPPARYTDDTLIKAMEEKGIGRPSTYAPTIATVISRDYVEREKKQLIPTELGKIVNKLMMDNFKDIVNVKFTAGLENQLEEIAEGSIPWVKVMSDFYGDFKLTLDKASEKMDGVKIKVPEEETDIVCEKCGRKMVIRSGRNGKFLACPGFPECKNTKSIRLETPAKCPLCGSIVLEKRSKRGKTYFGCENNPKCSFMTWDKPLAQNCPKCGKSLFKENRRGGKTHCLNESCGYEKETEKSNAKETD